MGLFGVSKKALAKYPHLSPQDAELCWKFFKCDLDKEGKLLDIAITSKRYDALAELCKFEIWQYGLRQAITTAYRARDERALELLAGNHSLFAMDKDCQDYLLDMITEYSDPWCTGLSLCLPIVKKLDLDRQIDAIFDFYTDPYDQTALLRKLYTVHAAKAADITITCLSRAGAFEVALDAMPVDAQTPVVLARASCALMSKISEGDKAEKLDRMIKMGMNVNYDKGVVLSTALHTRNFDLAQKIIDAGFHLELLGAGVLEEVYSSSGHPEAIAFMEKALGRSNHASSACGVTQTLEHDGFALVASDTVARRIDLPDGGHLSVVFNFTLRQQIVVANQNGHASAAIAVMPFESLPAADALDAAATAFKALGGKAAIADRAAYAARPLIAHKPEARS